MLIRSKHSGWLGDGTRTPFGGGNPFKGVTNAISKGLGTDGSGGGVLGALADIDPGPAIGKALADVDKFVGREIPGGWITVGAVTAGGLAIAYAPQVMAYAAANGVAPATASSTLGLPGVVANGALAGTPVVGSTASTLGSLGWTAPTIGGTAAKAGTFGALNAALPAAGSAFGSLSAAIPAGTMVGNGLAGTVIGKTYMAAGPGQFALNAAGKAIPASSIGIGGFAPPSGTISSAKKLAEKLLEGNNGSQQPTQQPTRQQFGQFQAMNQVPQAQFGGVLRGNQNPFLANAGTTIVDPDAARMADPNSPTFGLSNLLKDFSNYG